MSDHDDDVQAVQSIGSVSTILRVIAETTGLRFVCVARVTPKSWTTCAVLDELDFGLQAGDTLDISTTLCERVRSTNAAVLIDNVSTDAVFKDHHVPKMYGFESYFSVPIHRPGGEFFGTLCGLDPLPSDLKVPKVRDMLTLFADLISRHLESETRLASAEKALRDERETTELREQFIAVLGHDLRTPLSSIMMGAELLTQYPLGGQTAPVLDRIKHSVRRISSLIDDVMDFTRGRMGSGIPVNLTETTSLAEALQHVVSELQSTHRDCTIHTDFRFDGVVVCDPGRLAQLLSNLLVNALVHGDTTQPVTISGDHRDGSLTVAVSNAGNPIPEETVSRLFQPFWRGADRDASSGLGLGLYIASEIARSHKGTLTVTSTPEATTFTFLAKVAASEGSAREALHAE